jgi:hypothetical protein
LQVLCHAILALSQQKKTDVQTSSHFQMKPLVEVHWTAAWELVEHHTQEDSESQHPFLLLLLLLPHAAAA